MLKLVYGCLAFSLVACVILFVGAAKKGDGFHGMTKSMGDAIGTGATVLDADRDGAITQTGNGKVVGFKRNGEQNWSTKFDRFEESPSNPYGAGANDATAWCAGACPAALVEIESEFSMFGTANKHLATELNYGPPKPEDFLALSGGTTAFLRQVGDGSPTPKLYVVGPGQPAKPLSRGAPSEVQPTQPKSHAVVGSAKGAVGALDQLILKDGKWQTTGRAIAKAGLKNVCVSADEKWVGAVSNRVSRFAFGGSFGAPVGPQLTTGTCTVDGDGITAIFTPKSDPTKVVAARYNANGRAVWVHKFGAQRLLSPAGSPFVVTQAANGTVTAIDARSGRDAYSGTLVGVPFVGSDGSIVTANRKGEPTWVFTGRASSN